MVVDTTLTPLTDFFDLVASDTLEQWYDVSAAAGSQFSPNRQSTPLVLTPIVQAYDPDSGRKYTITSYTTIHWYTYVLNESTGVYAETEITSTTNTDDYYKSGTTLVVRKNVATNTGVEIRCVVDYVDPRSTNDTIRLTASVKLTTNQDATVNMPFITVLAEKNTPYNPLGTASSQKTFVAKAMVENADKTNDVYFLWYATDDTHTTETLIDETTTISGVSVPVFPCYVSGQGTSTLVVDALYTEKINIICRCKASSSASTPLYPSKRYLTMSWDVPSLDSITYTNDGSAVNLASNGKRFRQIVNADGKTLNDSIVGSNLLFKWTKYRTSILSNNSPQADVIGWGTEMFLESSDLINVKTNGQMPSTIVGAEVYLRGAYEVVYDRSGNPVTSSGALVYQRV